MMFKYVLTALVCLACATGQLASPQGSDWSYVPVDPDDAGFNLLASVDQRVFLDEPTPLWAVLDPYVGDLSRNEDCFSLTGLNSAKRPLRKASDGLDTASTLTTALETTNLWLDRYALGGAFSNRFSGTSASVHLPQYSSFNRNWITDQLVFCGIGTQILYESPTIFNFALGAWEHPSYSGWVEAEYIKVHPERWNAIGADEFSRQFQTGLGLVRQQDYLLYGSSAKNADQQPNDWAGTMGLLPAIVMVETEKNFDPQRGAFSDPRQRYKYMLMQLNEPLTGYHSRRYTSTSVDEKKFSATAFWWTILTQLVGEFGDDISALEALMRDRYERRDFLYAVDRFIADYDGEHIDGLSFFLPQFAAAYANWPETMFDGQVEEKLWLQESFGGCTQLQVDERTVFSSDTISLREDTAQCIDVILSSALQAYTGTVHLRFYGDARIIENFNIAVSKSPDGGLCENKHVKDADCLVTPPQAKLENGQAARFYSGDYQEAEAGAAKTTRFIVSHVPEASAKRETFGVVDRDNIDVVLSLEVASVDSPLPVSKSWSTVYAGKAGPAPVGPFGDSESPNAKDAIFNRSMGTSRAILERAADAGSIMIGMTNEDGDEVTFIPDDKSILKTKQTGTFEATGIVSFADDDLYALQDPDKPSTLSILEHSEFALHFEGVANVCFIRETDQKAREKEIVREGLRIGMIEGLEARERAARALEDRLNLDDPCGAAFQRGPVKVKGSVPFPDTWTKDGMLTTWTTDSYLKLRNLRASRIRKALYGGGSSAGGFGGQSSGNGPSSQSGSGSGSSGSASGTDAQCRAPIYTDTDGCICSCEALSCLQSKSVAGSATATEKGCRLFCGSDWSACQ